MKDKIAMKIYDTLDTLEKKMEELLKITDNERIKSLSVFNFYLKTFYSVFKR